VESFWSRKGKVAEDQEKHFGSGIAVVDWNCPEPCRVADDGKRRFAPERSNGDGPFYNEDRWSVNTTAFARDTSGCGRP
jgi:hypothetical protein